MKVSKKWLEDENACEEGIRWFGEHFGGEAECQEVLDKLAEINKTDWAVWLNSFG